MSGVLGVNKRRIGAKFDDADRMWVFGLLRSRSPHVEATDINMTGDTDLSGEHALRHYIVHHQCVEMDQHVDHELSSRILYKARVVWEMIIKTLSSTDSWDSPAVQSPSGKLGQTTTCWWSTTPFWTCRRRSRHVQRSHTDILR